MWTEKLRGGKIDILEYSVWTGLIFAVKWSCGVLFCTLLNLRLICGGRFLDKQINCYLFVFDSVEIKHKLTAGFLRWVLLYIVSYKG